MELSDSLQTELLKEFTSTDSPDLFSTDESLIEIKIDKSDPSDNTGCHSQLSNCTSKLFDEMQKLDEEDGLTNLSMPQESPLEQNASRDGDLPKRPADATSELKARVNRKITDYFSRKPV